jgi:quercetin dioxygenase-like cupin family protein
MGKSLVRRASLLVTSAGVLVASAAFAQAPAPAAPAPAAGQPQAPATGQPPGRGGGVGSQGDPDPGVHFVVVIDNPSVRVLQVTLQPGAVRREHVHNDVTFHMLVPVTGSLELTAGGLGTVTAAPGQAYYMVKGQPHAFTNKTAAAVQVIEVFVKGPAPDPWKAEAPTK